MITPETAPSTRRWAMRPLPPEHAIEALREPLRLSKPLATLLLQRGIDSFDAAKTYFTPSLEQLHDPFLMKDMDLAVDRLCRAIDQGEGILVYGDYDVDGTTSVAMVHTFLSGRAAQVQAYVPDRYKEGYGVSEAGIDYAAEQGLSLIVALDCGIKALRLVKLAKERGIDFIICDHHTPGPELPEAVAVLDPKRADCPYPYKELTGCGVGFKLLQAFCRRTGLDETKELYQHLDLVSVSTACDIVPITGENRVLCAYGLERINTAPRTGLKALMEAGSLRSPLTVSGLVFGIGPRINAAGRIDHGKHAVRLLCSGDEQEAQALAHAVNEQNDLRREYDSSITEEALEMIAQTLPPDACSTVLFSPGWHKGVIGIVASRCIEHYHRPTIILTESKGKATGSARSVRGFSIYEALCACEDLLDQFGGHDFAAGMTLALDRVPAFRERFEQEVRARITPEQLVPRIDIDAEVELSNITPNFHKVISRMEPFGPQNMAPVFMARNVRALQPPRLLKEQHVKITLGQDGFDGQIDAIAFRRPDLFPKIAMGEPFHVCFTVEENTFNGRTSLQLLLKDASFAQDPLAFPQIPAL